MQQIFSDKDIREQQSEILKSFGVTQKDLKIARDKVNEAWFKEYYGNLDRAYRPTYDYILSLVDCFINETIWNVNRATWWMTEFDYLEAWLPWDGIGLGGQWINEYTDRVAFSQVALGFPCHNHLIKKERPEHVKMVLAFEVLEHVQNPIQMVCDWGDIEAFCHRSPFKVRSHGHWDEYFFNGEAISCTRAGAKFSHVLRKYYGWKLGHKVLNYDRHINGVPTFFIKD